MVKKGNNIIRWLRGDEEGNKSWGTEFTSMATQTKKKQFER